jgi:hypothetical protein
LPALDRELTPNEEALAQASRWWQVAQILDEFHTERDAQYKQWGEQDIPLGFGGRIWRMVADQYRRECDEAAERGELTMKHILLEEFHEALAESDPKAARDELVQVGACVVQAIQLIDKEKMQ